MDRQLSDSYFKMQERRMDKFLNWLKHTVHSIKIITPDIYEEIFYKVGDKGADEPIGKDVNKKWLKESLKKYNV